MPVCPGSPTNNFGVANTVSCKNYCSF